MRTVLVVVLVCAVADLIACGMLLAVVWAEYRRVQRAARDAGEPVPGSAAGDFAALGVFLTLGLLLAGSSLWALARH